jgi:accessory secretory protein Asp3
MAAKEIGTVRWGSHNSPASLYGSALTMRASGEVRLANRLMPGGTTIQEWYSFTDYQSVRDSPTLPLLHHGVRYRIAPRVVATPAGTLVFEVRFLDRFGGLAGTTVLYGPDFAFTYPADCHSYSIRLVNAGCDELVFTSLTLLEDDGDA